MLRLKTRLQLIFPPLILPKIYLKNSHLFPSHCYKWPMNCLLSLIHCSLGLILLPPQRIHNLRSPLLDRSGNPFLTNTGFLCPNKYRLLVSNHGCVHLGTNSIWHVQQCVKFHLSQILLTTGIQEE